MSQGVPAEVREFQKAHPGSMTRGQLRDTLGLSESTMKRYIRKGLIPGPAMYAPNGWYLWSDEQVKVLLARRIERRYQGAGPLV